MIKAPHPQLGDKGKESVCPLNHLNKIGITTLLAQLIRIKRARKIRASFKMLESQMVCDSFSAKGVLLL